MNQYILKLKTTSTVNYAIYDGTTALTDAEITTLFTTAGSAYFSFDFDSLTPTNTTSFNIVDSNDTVIIANTGLTGIAESKNFKGTWSASATEFDSFTVLEGKTLDESELSFLMHKIKNAGGGPTVVQTTGTSTADVMSQNAVSRLIFPSETDKTRLAIGINASASANSTIAIGGVSSRQTLASGSRGVAIGLNARATAYCSVAIGGDTDSSSYGATANYSHSIAIGSYSITGRTSEFSLGGVNYSGNIVTRYIANVTDPTLPQDAATKNYVDTAVAGAGATVLTNTQYNNLWSNA